MSTKEKWALLRVDFDGAGDPIVDVVEIFDGPNSERDANKKVAHLRCESLTDEKVSSVTKISGTVYYLIRKVGQDSDP